LNYYYYYYLLLLFQIQTPTIIIKLKEIQFTELDQHNNCVANSALLDLVFSNIDDLSASITSFPVVTTDKYHPPLLKFKLTLNCHHISLTPRRSYAKGDYMLLYNVLRHSDWSCVLNENAVDAAVNNLTATVRKAVHLAIPYARPKNSAFCRGVPIH
jgi:hypothetical protein